MTIKKWTVVGLFLLICHAKIFADIGLGIRSTDMFSMLLMETETGINISFGDMDGQIYQIGLSFQRSLWTDTQGGKLTFDWHCLPWDLWDLDKVVQIYLGVGLGLSYTTSRCKLIECTKRHFIRTRTHSDYAKRENVNTATLSARVPIGIKFFLKKVEFFLELPIELKIHVITSKDPADGKNKLECWPYFDPGSAALGIRYWFTM